MCESRTNVDLSTLKNWTASSASLLNSIGNISVITSPLSGGGSDSQQSSSSETSLLSVSNVDNYILYYQKTEVNQDYYPFFWTTDLATSSTGTYGITTNYSTTGSNSPVYFIGVVGKWQTVFYGSEKKGQNTNYFCLLFRRTTGTGAAPL